ncbi:MAG TPA: hypothetical protein VGG46_03825 [Terriglobales bacterium]|jgi:hypothetical protein
MARISRRAFCARVIAYLRSASEEQENKIYWDDYCIAWMTVAKAAHGESHPHFWATYEHLGTAPEQIWPMIMAKRRNNLGPQFASWFDQAGNLRPDLPKKSSGSEKFQQEKIARVSGMEGLPKKQTAEALIPRRSRVIEGPRRMASTPSRYPNSEQSASVIMSRLCLLCGEPSRRVLCAACLRRGHSSSCPSPNSQCSCGFSDAFWRDVCA